MNIKRFLNGIFLVPLLFVFVACDENFFETDATSYQLVAFYDLRDRDSFVQITNTSSTDNRLHIQVFNVDDNCNENNFFDSYTGNDTHVYNLSNITTNDGNPAGFVLPDNAYGIVVVTTVDGTGQSIDNEDLVGNFRVIDNSGYEYRTNLLGLNFISNINNFNEEITFNFNKKGGVSLSDVVAFTLDDIGTGEDEVLAADIVSINVLVDVNILNLNENIFSCRNVIFACTDQDHPLLEELLEEREDSNVASFEYGINEAIPHSKGGELLCPGNNIEEGIVKLDPISSGENADGLGIFIGLNNGNGRGSMDTAWIENAYTGFDLL